ncbi:magnesium transporter [Candidatus Poriferisocius sp.]|uniref:magnesium transporter n=1 Tax=Candidatus Poriferisocius sp. TaxID=3101276 RepID=UPI003B01315F
MRSRTVLTLLRRSGSRLQLVRLLGPDPRGVRQSLGALCILAVTSVIAGLVLGRSHERLAELPGLLLLVPAAIALPGKIFGALGSRLGTAIHTGTFRLSLRSSSVVGQNVWASLVLTLLMTLVLALLASAMASNLGVENAIGVADYVVISVVGGMLASVFVLLVTLGMATGSVRWGLDPDNVTAPMVTAAGDVLALPALILASYLVRIDTVTPVIAGLLAVVAVVSSAAALRSKAPELRTVLRESIPVLVLAGFLSLMAGVTVENRFEVFSERPVLLVLIPGFLATAGALGGILTNRLSSKLHLGLIGPSVVPHRGARTDVGVTIGLALPVFVIVALVSQGAGSLVHLAGPGVERLVGVALIGGILAVVVVVAVAYYGTIAAVRFGIDPDSVGIPTVTAVLDLVGALTLVFAIEAVGAG